MAARYRPVAWAFQPPRAWSRGNAVYASRTHTINYLLIDISL